MSHLDTGKFLLVILIGSVLILPVLAADSSDQINSAGALYSKSVDLANAGNYSAALEASDEALALNDTSLVPLIQANRAGILVMLGRFEEANTAADAALAVEGNLTAVHSVAWYNKGNALRSLGRCGEAKTAYTQAAILDPALVSPDLTLCTVSPSPSPTKSQLSPSTVLLALASLFIVSVAFTHTKK